MLFSVNVGHVVSHSAEGIWKLEKAPRASKQIKALSLLRHNIVLVYQPG